MGDQTWETTKQHDVSAARITNKKSEDWYLGIQRSDKLRFEKPSCIIKPENVIQHKEASWMSWMLWHQMKHLHQRTNDYQSHESKTIVFTWDRLRINLKRPLRYLFKPLKTFKTILKVICPHFLYAWNNYVKTKQVILAVSQLALFGEQKILILVKVSKNNPRNNFIT